MDNYFDYRFIAEVIVKQKYIVQLLESEISDIS